MTHKPIITLALLSATLAALAPAVAQTTYRWVDPASGRTIISDRPPPASVKQVARKEGAAPGDNPQATYAARIAAEKFPVTLYTSADCAEQCSKARTLLNGRGVPFREKMVQAPSAEFEELKKLTGGEAFVPVILVGTQSVKGFEPGGWHNLLDLAGYPKTAAFGQPPAASPLTQPPAASPLTQPPAARLPEAE